MQLHPSSSRSGKHKWNAGGGLPRYLAGPPLLPALTNTAHKIPTGISSQRSGRQRITRVLRFQQMVIHPFIKKQSKHMPAGNQTHNTRHKSLKQKAFVLNFLQISFIHSSHLCSHSNVPLSFPIGEPLR